MSALRLGDILIIGEKRRREERGRREERERNGWREKEEKLSSAIVALSEDASLHTLVLFCLAPQSEESNTEDSYCTDLETQAIEIKYHE